MQLLTVSEFAKRLGVGRSTAYRIVAHGEVAVTDVGHGRPRLRITEDAFKRYVAKRTEQGRRAA